VYLLRECAAGPFKARDGVPYNAIWGRACIEIKFTCQEKEKVDFPADICRVEYLCAVFQSNSCIDWPFSSSARRKHLADVYIRVRAKRSRFFDVATGAFEIMLGLQLRYTNLFSCFL
jgi:hypothetical protein